MFQPNLEECNNDNRLGNYHLAVESFVNVESLLKNEHVNFAEIHQELHKCYQRVGTLITENNPYLVDILFHFGQCMLELIKAMQSKITKQVVFPAKETDAAKAESVIKSTIETPRVSGLNEIAGLWDIKKVLKSLVILPRYQPQLFDNLKASNSVLLFGPPGTGKTRLVHALASEANAVLHSVSVGTMLSPLVGQTEKNVQALFEHVRCSENFSILFIDEVDGFCRTRHGSEQDHTRRMKTELMCQMSKIEDARNVFLICATNCPWDLDTAFLRRFHKRVYVPLPDIAERHELFQLFTKGTSLEKFEPTEDLNLIIEKTEGFSGSDISDLVQSALNRPITKLQDTIYWKYTIDGFYEPVILPKGFNLEDVAFREMDINWEDIVLCELESLPCRSVRARPAQISDLFKSLEEITRTVSLTDVKRFEEFIIK